MNRSLRTFVVLVTALGLAGSATFLVYRAIVGRPAVEVEVASTYAVVASHPLPLGTRLTSADVKLVAWPASSPVPGGFATIEDVVDRGVIAPVSENEPLTGNNIAVREAGAGLPPTIPPGMRAISVKVNEVIGVAGFVVPGTRVDVMVILAQGDSRIARVVVSNVTVLTAGTRYDQEIAKEGGALPSSVVTLLVTPKDAELISLAATQGQIMLTLRNPLDVEATPSQGTSAASLMGGSPAPPRPAPSTTRSAPRAAAATPPPPPPPPAPKPVVVIKAGQVTEIKK